MTIKKIIIDDKTQAKQLDSNKIQLDLIAFPLNEGNQKEPDVEIKLYVDNQLLQNLTSDLQGNIKESLIINWNGKDISIKLQDISSWITSEIKTLFLWWKKETNNVHKNNNISEKDKLIVQMKANPQSIDNIPREAKDDPDIVRYALEQNWSLIGATGEKIRNNKEMIFIAMKTDLYAFGFASNELKTDEDFCLECIKKFGIKIVHQIPNYTRNLPKIKDEIDKANKPIKELEDKISELYEKRKTFDFILNEEAESKKYPIYNELGEYCGANSSNRQSIWYINEVEIPKVQQEIKILRQQIRWR